MDRVRGLPLVAKIGIGAATAAGGVALAAVGVAVVLPAVGFTTAGITAGSTAAGIMSSSAIASGGGVVAGGMVATLQSIGAAGLGAGGYAMADAVGGTTGLAITETVDQIQRRLKARCEPCPIVKYIADEEGEGRVIILLRRRHIA